MAKNGISRREFMGRTGLGLVSTGLGLPLLKTSCVSKDQSYRTLGRTKLRIPVVSFGVMNSDSPDLLRKALEMGIKYLDTAHGYLRGNSEKVIGEVLKETGKRDRVYVGTKMRLARDREKGVFLSEGSSREPLATEANFNEQLNTSLERLQTDIIDILYLHSCYTPQMVTYEPMMNALVKAKEAGKARFIGLSTHTNEPDVIRTAVDSDIYDVVLTSYNYMQEQREEIKKAIAYAAKKGIGIVAMKTMGGNRLNLDENVKINHKAALKWVLNDENVCTTIPGMTTFEQMDLNMSVMGDLELTEDEKRELKISSLLRGTLFCQNCRSCVSTCSRRVEIPLLMRSYMYAVGYGNLIQAETTIAELPEHRDLDVCRDCSTCSATCRFGIDIPDRLESLMNIGYA